ncbi:MAG: GTPase domain-containing protein [Burkholderiaceae bacterium]
MDQAPSGEAVSLSLVSHTNAGKTTLARTLLGRDIGEIRDAPHVTEFADVYTMLETPQGDALQLWDTPGFGDSVRLAKRLRSLASPMGWFLSEVWDRWRDRSFWASQQALRNVRDEADVMLYLVNAAEAPEAAGYVKSEMELLAWVDKPVIVLLNQLGAPREAALEAAEIERWRVHLAPYPQVRAVLPLDAFARCWVQELTLLRAIEDALGAQDGVDDPHAFARNGNVGARTSPDSGAEGAAVKRARMARLRAAWQGQRLQTFEAAMASLARHLARSASLFEVVPDDGFGTALRARLRNAGAALGVGRTTETSATAQAQQSLAQRLDAEVRANTQELIALHGLSGSAHGEILARLASQFDLRLRWDERKAALWGGVLSGALVGLKADLASGGLTLGGGMIAGGVLGALGAAGLARCVNLVRGTDRSWLTWNAEALDRMVEAALLRYLAVAHFGRGRGDWAEGEAPPHWQGVVEQVLAPQHEALTLLWEGRDPRHDGSDECERLAAAIEPRVRDAASKALCTLYPGSQAALEAPEAQAASPVDGAVGENAQATPAPAR